MLLTARYLKGEEMLCAVVDVEEAFLRARSVVDLHVDELARSEGALFDTASQLAAGDAWSVSMPRILIVMSFASVRGDGQ